MAVSLISMIIYTDISMLELLSLTKQIHNADKEPMVAALLLSLPSALKSKLETIAHLDLRTINNQEKLVLPNQIELALDDLTDTAHYQLVKQYAQSLPKSDYDQFVALLEDRVKELGFELGINNVFRYFFYAEGDPEFQHIDTMTKLIKELKKRNRISNPTLHNKLQTMIGNAIALCPTTQSMAKPIAGIDEQDERSKTQLIRAVIDHDIAMVKKLLDHGADVNMTDKYSITSLIYTVIHNNQIDMAKILLDHGADVNMPDKFGKTPLMYVVTTDDHYSQPNNNNRFDMLKLLLDHKADIDMPSKNGFTPLIYAARYNKLDMVKILLDHKADVNKKDKDGYTALMVAIAKSDFITMNVFDNEKDKIDQINIIKALIDKTVDPQQLYKHIKNKRYKTALDMAKRDALPDIIKLLEA